MKPRLRVILIAGVFVVAIIFGLFKNMKTNDIVNGSIGFGKPTPATSAVSNEEQDQTHKKMIEIAMKYEPLKLLMKENPQAFSVEVIKVPGTTNKEVVRIRKKVDSFVFWYHLAVNIETGQCIPEEFNDIVDADKAMTIASKAPIVLKNIKNVKNYVEFFSEGSSGKFPLNYFISVREHRRVEDGGEISYSYSVNIETGKVEKAIIN